MRRFGVAVMNEPTHQKQNPAIEILESIHIDAEELTEELSFSYQHEIGAVTNPNAFTKLNDTGDWVMSCCPLHPESRASFGINKEAPYHCNCFYCGYIGTVDQMIEQVFDLDEGEGLKMLLSGYILDEKPVIYDMVADIENKRERLVIPDMPESYLQEMKESRQSNELMYRAGMSYMLQRGFDQRTLDTYEICVDTATGTLVFPQRTRRGGLRFVQKRKVGDAYHGAKFINEGNKIKRDILFGLHFINKFRATKDCIKRVRLVESPTDCMSNYQVGIPAVSINGRILFRNQIKELLLAGVNEVDLMLDNDAAGSKGMEDAAKALDRAGIVVNKVMYPSPFLKDSNDLLRAGMLDKLETRNVNMIGNIFK